MQTAIEQSYQSVQSSKFGFEHNENNFKVLKTVLFK